MVLVYVLYGVIVFQCLLFVLYFSGNWFRMSLFLEFTQLSLRIFLCIFKSLLRWILPKQRKSVRGEIALITGAANGIGRLIAIDLAKKGCKVVVWDIDQDKLHDVVNEIEAFGGVVKPYICNLRNKDKIYKTAQRVKEEVGEVSLLVNNAGVVTGKKLLDSTDDEILSTFDVNSFAHFWTIKQFLPSMLEQNHGHIVSIASIAGHTGFAGAVDYCSSKFAAVGLMESLRREVAKTGKTGIYFTTICPSLITTGMFEGVKFRFPHLLGFGILTPEYAASKVIDAIEKNQIVLMMPRGAYVATVLQNILPEKATDLLLNFLGVATAMDTFTGRLKTSTVM